MKIMVNFNLFHNDGIELKTIEELDTMIVGKKLSEMDLEHGQEVEILGVFNGLKARSVWKVMDTKHDTFREGLRMKIIE
ncbi:MAG: hypothetical protein ACRDCW_02370 [Sarcina sp.]